jgi:hypothetical protein
MSVNSGPDDKSQGMFERLKKEMQSPVALIGTFLGIAGIALSFYFYYIAIPDKNLYFFAASPTEVISRTVPSRMIAISRIDGHPIKGNVYVVKVYLWAGRDLQTRSDDIREPIRIGLEKATVIDASLSISSHPDISKYSFIKTTPSVCESGGRDEPTLAAHDLNYVALYWCVFDAKMGVVVSIVYDAKKQEPVSVKGYVSGIKDIIEVPEREVKANVRPGQLWSTTWKTFAIIIGAMIFMIFLILGREFLGHIYIVGRVFKIMVMLMPWVGVLLPVGYIVYQAAVVFGVIGTIATMPSAIQDSS